ncbi:MAG: TlpA family protein disulfide reductase [Candidatus Cloacimonetes bacterium]|nr:TlpA family protein disulfide reductase [Candidatus Cloacimonadota bacterium]
MRKLSLVVIILMLGISFITCAETKAVQVTDFTLNDLDGNPVTISELDGLIILDFWATWCPPCKVEIPYLQSFYEEFGDQGLFVVGISSEEPAIQKKFVEDMKKEGVEMTYILLVDGDGAVTREYGIRSIPTTIFVKSDLTQIEREVGFRPEYAAKFREIIEKNLPKR